VRVTANRVRALSALACAMLAAVVLPSGCTHVHSAPRLKCMAHLYAIAGAMRMYQDDWGGYPPPYDPLSGRGGVSALYANADLADTEVLRCPEDPTTLAGYNRLHGTHWNPATFDKCYSSYNEEYNYWGYDARGEPLRSRREAAKTYAGRRGWQGRLLWTTGAPGAATAAFPGLVNPKAPDGTVITHCPWHRPRFRGTQPQDPTAFLGTDIMAIPVTSYDWITQPPPPGASSSGPRPP